MTKYTRSQIRANRQKWIDFLMVKGRKKTTGRLDKGGGARCCLGHGCHVLGIKPEKIETERGSFVGYDDHTETAPVSFVEMVGLWTPLGSVRYGYASIDVFGRGEYENIKETLADINDETKASPRKIGEYLLSVIEGGGHTPFRPLSEYGE